MSLELSADVIALIVTMVATAVGATWFLCSRLTRVESLTQRHIKNDDEFKGLVRNLGDKIDTGFKEVNGSIADLSTKVGAVEGQLTQISVIVHKPTGLSEGSA